MIVGATRYSKVPNVILNGMGKERIQESFFTS